MVGSDWSGMYIETELFIKMNGYITAMKKVMNYGYSLIKLNTEFLVHKVVDGIQSA